MCPSVLVSAAPLLLEVGVGCQPAGLWVGERCSLPHCPPGSGVSGSAGLCPTHLGQQLLLGQQRHGGVVGFGVKAGEEAFVGFSVGAASAGTPPEGLCQGRGAGTLLHWPALLVGLCWVLLAGFKGGCQLKLCHLWCHVQL